MAARFYVYGIFDGDVCLYVGKGSGGRDKQSARRVGGSPKILERFDCEDACYEAEVSWISELQPTENRNKGGGGSRTDCAERLPKILRGVMSLKEWLREKARHEKEINEMERLGPRRYVARFLLTRLNSANCESWGVSKVDLSRLREVAHG